MARTTTGTNDDGLTEAEQEQIDALLFEDSPSVSDDDDPDEEFDLSEIRAYGQATGIVQTAPTKQLTQEAAAFMRTQGLLSVTRVMALEPPNWFLHELIPEAQLTVVHGPGGTRKSFVMLDWMLCADAGITWHERPIRPGRCLYILGEGISGVGKRITAWCEHNQVAPDSLRMHFVSHPLDLYGWSKQNEKGEFGTQVESWRSMVEAMGFDYVVVDTLHRNAPGADENSALDIGRVFAATQRIAGNAHMFFIHHDPKESKTARGSSSIHDDADVVVRIQKKDDHVSTLHAEKLRDADDFKPVDMHFLKDKVNNSLVIDSIEQWKPKKSKRQEIIDTIRAEPGHLTQEDIVCVVGTPSYTRALLKDLRDAGIVYTEVRPRTKNKGPKMVDMYFVDESKMANDQDEEFQFDDD